MLPFDLQPVDPTTERFSTPYQPSSATSKAAAQKAERFVCKQGRDVLGFILDQGDHGATQKEAERALGIGRPSLAARFNGLEAVKLIRKTDITREACAVYLAVR